MNKSQASKLVYLSPDKILTHPKNLRRFYPEAHVHEMAASISAAGGVLQPLRIVSNGNGKYFAVDGNMRLAGARHLGDDCPELKCELVTEDEADQLLAMVITSKFRYDPDPISEALHYQRLMDEESYKVHEIAELTGLHARTIESRLKLLKLDAEIQELIGLGQLPKDVHAAEALLLIADPLARVKMAQRLAKDGASVKVIIAACDRLVSRLAAASQESKEPNALASARGRSFGKQVTAPKKVDWTQLRDASIGMCSTCEIRLSSLEKLPAPAWSLISHAADTTCGACDVREIQGACGQCPGVDMIQRLIGMVGER